MGKKERTFYTESGFNLVPRAFPPLSFSKKECPWDEARRDSGRGVVHVSEKYFILAIKITFLNLNSV